MNFDREDGDLRHMHLGTARDQNRCHLCLKDRRHPDHVSYTRAEELHQLIASAIDEARAGVAA